MSIDRLSHSATGPEAEGQPKQSNLEAYTERLLEELDSSAVPRTAQSVIDSVLGALVANGKVEGSQKAYQPEEIALLFDRAARDENMLNAVPRADGCRKVCLLLVNEKRTKPLLTGPSEAGSNLSDRIAVGGEGGRQIAFASTDILRGYMAAVLGAYGSSPEQAAKGFDPADAEGGHEEQLMAAIESYVNSDSHVGFLKHFENMLRNPSSDKYRVEAIDLERSLKWLADRGVSRDIIESTANRLRGMDLELKRAGKVGGAVVQRV